MKVSILSPFAFLVVGSIAYLIGSSPSGVSPPVIPADSRAAEVPPWPIFRVAVGLSDVLRRMADALTPAHARARILATAYWDSNILFALTKRRIFDMFDNDTKLANCTDIARRANLYEDYTCRYMRAGASLGLFDELPGKMFRLATVGEVMREDHPQSQLYFAEHIKDLSAGWEKASQNSIDTSSSGGFKEAYGIGFLEFLAQDSNNQAAKNFNDAMSDLSKSIVGALAVDWAPPKPDAKFCDIGGGLGTVLVEMAMYYPQLQGIVFDLPSVVAPAEDYIAENEMSDRIQAVGGNFLDDLPPALEQCDVFLLKHVLHDWGDDVCVQILQNVMKVARKGSKIVGVDFSLDGSHPAFRKTITEMDINMIVASTGGRERTKKEYVRLFKDAGIPVDGHKFYPVRDPVSIVEFEV